MSALTPASKPLEDASDHLVVNGVVESADEPLQFRAGRLASSQAQWPEDGAVLDEHSTDRREVSAYEADEGLGLSSSRGCDGRETPVDVGQNDGLEQEQEQVILAGESRVHGSDGDPRQASDVRDAEVFEGVLLQQRLGGPDDALLGPGSVSAAAPRLPRNSRTGRFRIRPGTPRRCLPSPDR